MPKKKRKTTQWGKKIADFLFGQGTPQGAAIRKHKKQLERAARPYQTEPGNVTETYKNYKKVAERN